ncbi:lysozyme inhibitor LprI family protein [Azospirillum sp. sgz301742]
MAQITPRFAFLGGIAVALLAGPPGAVAASFPCAKASTPVEKAICADPAVSKLDERMAAAFKEAIQRLGGSDPDTNAIQAAVKADQKAWLADRNACGPDAGCLRTSYERRLAVLTFKPDPGAPSPADPYIGRFDYGGFMDVAVLGLRNGTLAFSVNGAEPKSARWVCDFSGIGRVNEKGALVVGTPDAEGNGLIVERNGPAGIRIPENDANRATSGNWCGMNGSILFDYVRRK